MNLTLLKHVPENLTDGQKGILAHIARGFDSNFIVHRTKMKGFRSFMLFCRDGKWHSNGSADPAAVKPLIERGILEEIDLTEKGLPLEKNSHYYTIAQTVLHPEKQDMTAKDEKKEEAKKEPPAPYFLLSSLLIILSLILPGKSPPM